MHYTVAYLYTSPVGESDCQSQREGLPEPERERLPESERRVKALRVSPTSIFGGPTAVTAASGRDWTQSHMDETVC